MKSFYVVLKKISRRQSQRWFWQPGMPKQIIGTTYIVVLKHYNGSTPANN